MKFLDKIGIIYLWEKITTCLQAIITVIDNEKQDKVIYTTVDPGEGSELAEGSLLVVYEP